MGYTIDELGEASKKALVGEMLDKKNGMSDKDWVEICSQFDLSVNAETLRKAGVGVKLVQDAGMIGVSAAGGAAEEKEPFNGYIERQKMRDLNSQVNAAYRSESRSQLLREAVKEAVWTMPEIRTEYVKRMDAPSEERQLVVAMGDFHYGADIDVRGLYGESLNCYDSTVFESRMNRLLGEIRWITEREDIGMVHVFLVGDLIDGILRQNQLMRLQYGLVESVMRLSEYLAEWIAELSSFAEVVVTGVTGNHSEVRPLKAKAREFEEENLEKIVFWFLHERLIHNDRVRVCEECDRMKLVKVCGYSFLLLHGDGDKSIDQIARSTVNLYGEKIDYFVCGHLHKEQEFPSGMTSDGNSVVIRVPSLCGADKYAQSKGYGGHAGATAMVIREGVGREVVYPIDLEKKC